MVLEGVVTTGLGKAAYYIGMDVYQERFNDVLGFYPFPGTLNIEVDPSERKTFQSNASYVHIDAPERNGEYLSAADAYPVHITTTGTEPVIAALLDLEITDHPASVAEIIAPINLRDEIGLTDGDTVTVEAR